MGAQVSLEIVTWRDAHFDIDEPSKPRKDFIVKTVGWTKERKRFLTIRSEKLPHGDGYRAVTNIPWGMVIARTPLKGVPNGPA